MFRTFSNIILETKNPKMQTPSRENIRADYDQLLETAVKCLTSAVQDNNLVYAESLLKSYYTVFCEIEIASRVYIPPFQMACTQNKPKMVKLFGYYLGDTFVLDTVAKQELKKSQENEFTSLTKALEAIVHEQQAFEYSMKALKFLHN